MCSSDAQFFSSFLAINWEPVVSYSLPTDDMAKVTMGSPYGNAWWTTFGRSSVAKARWTMLWLQNSMLRTLYCCHWWRRKTIVAAARNLDILIRLCFNSHKYYPIYLCFFHFRKCFLNLDGKEAYLLWN